MLTRPVSPTAKWTPSIVHREPMVSAWTCLLRNRLKAYSAEISVWVPSRTLAGNVPCAQPDWPAVDGGFRSDWLMNFKSLGLHPIPPLPNRRRRVGDEDFSAAARQTHEAQPIRRAQQIRIEHIINRFWLSRKGEPESVWAPQQVAQIKARHGQRRRFEGDIAVLQIIKRPGRVLHQKCLVGRGGGEINRILRIGIVIDAGQRRIRVRRCAEIA